MAVSRKEAEKQFKVDASAIAKDPSFYNSWVFAVKKGRYGQSEEHYYWTQRMIRHLKHAQPFAK